MGVSVKWKLSKFSFLCIVKLVITVQKWLPEMVGLPTVCAPYWAINRQSTNPSLASTVGTVMVSKLSAYKTLPFAKHVKL